MHPILIEIGGTPIIHTFGVLVLAGVLLGLWWIRRDAPRLGLDPEECVSLAVEVFLAGLVGSRIFFVLHNWDGMYADAPWWAPLNLRSGGLVWYGGLLAATPVAIWRAKAYGMPIAKLCDLLAPAVILGLAIGRIGCLMAGDDHGKIWHEETWFTLTFNDPNALMAEDHKGKPLLPSQPLMFLGCMIIFGILAGLRRKLASRPGAIATLLFVLYPIHRYLVELTRGDSVRGHLPDSIPLIGGLSTSQAISVPLELAAIGLFLFLVLRPPAEPAAGEEGKAPADPKAGAKAEEKADASSGSSPAAAEPTSPATPAPAPGDPAGP